MDTDTDTRDLIRRCDDLFMTPRPSCVHASFTKNICRACGEEAQGKNTEASSMYSTSVPFNYIEEDLRYSSIQAAHLKDQNTDLMLGRKKLHLVLDLDKTLLHAIPTKDYEEYLLTNQGDVPIVERTYVGIHEMVLKISPFVKEFLEEASTMFEMYVYTTGDRDYANAMTRLVDPEGVYFGPRIICGSEDCIRPGLKRLDLVLGNRETTLIVDHNRNVWPDHEENLILIQKYCYFDPGWGRGKQCCYTKMVRKDDSKDDRALRNVLVLLKKLHTRFFKEHELKKRILHIDVRSILKEVRGRRIEIIKS